MLNASLSLFGVFLILVVTEMLWKAKKLHGEIGRKFAHISIGCFVASWPFYLSFKSIQLISVAFLVGVIVTQRLKIFQSIRAIKRRTWGEVLFAAGVGITALIAQSPAIFAAAILHLAIGDGLAALIGSNYGKTGFKVWNAKLHWSGVLAFAVSSVFVTTSYIYFAQQQDFLGWPAIIWLPISSAIIESVSVRGTDNLTVPLYVTVVLNMLSFT